MKNHSSTPDKVIETSFKLLNLWEETPNFDLLLNKLRHEDNSEITDMTAALCRNIFRYRDTIDWLISKCSTKSPRGRIRKLLRIPVAQLLIDQQLPEALICDTAVRFCKKRFNKFDSGYVNKILRKIIEDRDRLTPPKSVSLNLSPELLKQWKKHFSEKQIQEWSKLLLKPAPMTVRQRHDAEIAPDEFSEILQPLELKKKSDWQYYKALKPKEFLKRNKNRFYIQDPAPTYSLSLLNPEPGEIIGDLCAAPGGKSLLIAEKLKNKGTLHSCDLSPKRLSTIQENLKGFTNVKIQIADATNPEFDDEFFDSVLLDVPCTNSGVIRRKADVRWSFSRKKMLEIIEIQKSILNAVARTVKKDGTLIYSTCSIDPEENEEVIKDFLSKHKGYTLLEQDTLYPCEEHDGAFAARLKRLD